MGRHRGGTRLRDELKSVGNGDVDRNMTRSAWEGWLEQGRRRASSPPLPGLSQERHGEISTSRKGKNMSRSQGNKGELKKKKNCKDATLSIY